jgi:hypothetical protein
MSVARNSARLPARYIAVLCDILEGLGFEIGRRLDPTAHEVLGFALLTSPTLGHLLRLAVTYQRLLQPFFTLVLQRSAGRADLVYLPAAALSPRSVRVLEEDEDICRSVQRG